MPRLKQWNSILLCLMMTGIANAASGNALTFDPLRFTVKKITLGERPIRYRAYEGILYVSRPVDTLYHSMNVYVPCDYYEGRNSGPYTLESAPVFLPNTVGGYMPGKPGSPGKSRDGRPNAIFEALRRGYVVVCPGVRGRTLRDAGGQYTGKAPACIVDLKAAVRYLHYNDPIMPGDAGKIISNGTSAGGALSSLLGATGNSKDYEPYLQAIGAADERDDIFAASCYCPITNLDHADQAYEWLFNGIDQYDSWGKHGTLTGDQIELSRRLKADFPAYLNSLLLKGEDGTTLALNASGEGAFKDYVASYIIASAQKALDEGEHIPDSTGITVREGVVRDVDLHAFMKYATRMKPVPAFDALDLGSPENNLFGTEAIDNQHFTLFSRENSTDHSLADALIVKMMNPMSYIDTAGVSTAPHWRIRHGAIDRDTSLPIPVILATKLMNCGFNVDFAMPWGQGHAGDYDLDELFNWIDLICR